jgi:hypothetical protein
MLEKHLIVAPKSNLSFANSEVQRIANAGFPSVKLLIDNVTIREVMDALSDPFDAIWFISHGDSDGIELEDGTLTSSLLIQCLRQTSPKLIVLNTCSSLRVGIRLYESLRCAVVSTIIEIPDLTAFVTSAKFAQSLARGADITTAYNDARPDANREYILMNGTIQFNAKTGQDDTHRLLIRLFSQVDDLRDQIGELRKAISKPTNSIPIFILAWVFLFLPVFLFFQLGSLAQIIDSRELIWSLMSWTASAYLFGYSLGMFKEKEK